MCFSLHLYYFSCTHRESHIHTNTYVSLFNVSNSEHCFSKSTRGYCPFLAKPTCQDFSTCLKEMGKIWKNDCAACQLVLWCSSTCPFPGSSVVAETVPTAPWHQFFESQSTLRVRPVALQNEKDLHEYLHHHHLSTPLMLQSCKIQLKKYSIWSRRCHKRL